MPKYIGYREHGSREFFVGDTIQEVYEAINFQAEEWTDFTFYELGNQLEIEVQAVIKKGK